MKFGAVRTERRLLRGPAIAAVLLGAVIAIGTIGYVVLEGWGWFDSFYMTIMTVTTTGGGEPQPLTIAGKLWTIIVVTVGFGALTFTLLMLISYVIEGRLSAAFYERRMRRRVARMEGHFILCGYGRVGREVARNFLEEKIPFAVIDINADSLVRAADEGLTVVNGDAAHVETLKAAGVERARGLITCIDSDENNVYVTLSARVLNPKIFIVARANRDDTEPKLRACRCQPHHLALHDRRPAHREPCNASNGSRVRRYGALREQWRAALGRFYDSQQLDVDRAHGFGARAG